MLTTLAGSGFFRTLSQTTRSQTRVVLQIGRTRARAGAFGLGALFTFCAYVPSVRAQTTQPPIRQLGQAEAESAADAVSSIAALRALPAGGLLVNDVVRRRVVLLDSLLGVVKVVADTSSATMRRYGSAATGLFAFRGDSTLFLDGAALALLVIDASGNVTRVMAPPRVSDFGQLVGGAAGNPGLDERGRLVYRMAGAAMRDRIRSGRLGVASSPESVAVVRFDFSMRRIDTAGFVRIYSPRVLAINEGDNTSMTTWLSPVLNPAPVVDDWAILADGTIAIIRGQDYHVDFIDAHDRKVSGAKIPFSWRRLTDKDKVALIDSSKALRARLLAQGIPVGLNVAPAPGTEPTGTASTVVTTRTGSPPAAEANTTAPPVNHVRSEELPDYQPVFAAGAARADGDGRLWVRTIPPYPLSGGAIYDVIDRQGRLVDRIQVPRGSAIAGFAPKGVVFLGQRDSTALRIKRVRYHPPAPH